ncbi:hypothetical protein H1R82_02030 [Thermoactinomyces intermedius]|uniref:Uncharacterized protein n=1 Tax=Thermoactinomyces intermedius TaxID=2024 RepID=A0A8I1A7V5_THEIN|nr:MULTISPECIES: hypothetical protein [Thermoactinomyces]MBA4549724.1 hypothetical protein [Thermoactinomyces intermedius]MBA4835413.1 hypothetical protein [Thermoactinomyces intermedius]MBH8596048.1 hypothetical protein [Thermoactinomyces intermedius]MBH8602432.1 hypothetical protein [Thermoactinomyces sp. CICC 23799]
MSPCSKDHFPKVFFFAFVLITLLAIPSVRQRVAKFFAERLLPLFKGGTRQDGGSSGHSSAGGPEDDFKIRLDLNQSI